MMIVLPDKEKDMAINILNEEIGIEREVDAELFKWPAPPPMPDDPLHALHEIQVGSIVRRSAGLHFLQSGLMEDVVVYVTLAGNFKLANSGNHLYTLEYLELAPVPQDIPKKKVFDGYYPDFQTFILALHELDPKASRWIGERALLEEKGVDDIERRGVRRTSIISNWRYDFNINTLLIWDQTPQGHGYWSQLNDQMTAQRGANGQL